LRTGDEVYTFQASSEKLSAAYIISDKKQSIEDRGEPITALAVV
jgi:hypothetical protein